MAVSDKENMIMALQHKIPERIPNYRTDACFCIPSCVYERAPGDGTPQQMLGGTGKDWFGVNWVFEPVSGGSMVDPKYPAILTDITKWKEQVKFPDLDAIDWKAAREKDIPRLDTDKLIVVTLLNGPFERMHALMTMVEANCALIEEPEASAELLMAIADYKVELIKKILAHYPVDMIEVHDDWGHQTSSFMSPQTWNELIAPAMEKIVKVIKDNKKLIQVHSCGRVESLIPDMIRIGIDHWSSCQTCNDLREIICNYGDKLTLLGGMDTPELTDMNQSDEKIKAAVKTRIFDLCRGGGLLVYASRSYPRLIKCVNEVIAENPDFFKDPENRKLPQSSKLS